MKSTIIYGSCYGTAKQYAEVISVKTGIRCISYDEVDDINKYNEIIYVGGLYAGGVLGLAKTLKKLSTNTCKKLIIITVGLADTKDTKNIKNIRSSIQKQVSKEIYNNAQVFHLRGGIDYQKLNFKHRTMMKLLYNKLKKIPLEKQDAETKALIETYNQKVDFVNFDSLNNIIKSIS